MSYCSDKRFQDSANRLSFNFQRSPRQYFYHLCCHYQPSTCTCTYMINIFKYTQQKCLKVFLKRFIYFTLNAFNFFQVNFPLLYPPEKIRSTGSRIVNIALMFISVGVFCISHSDCFKPSYFRSIHQNLELQFTVIKYSTLEV